MTEYSIGAFELNEALHSDFAEIISIIKGRSIISAADWDGERFELGLSGQLMMRFFFTPDRTRINLIGTLNKDDIPPLVISLGDMPQQVPVNLIENKLKGLRTLYAISYLCHSDRTSELTDYLAKNPHCDIEKDLIGTEEQLYIESISYGSWLLTVWSKTTNGYKALSSVVGLVFVRGREAYLKQLEANARLAEATASREEIEAAKDEFNLKKDQMAYLLDISNRFDVLETQEIVRERILQSVKDLTLGDRSDYESYKKLE